MLPHPLSQLDQRLGTAQLKARVPTAAFLKVRGLAECDVDLLARRADVEPREGAFLQGRDCTRRQAEGFGVEGVCLLEGAGRDG